MDKDNIYSLKVDCGDERDFEETYPNLDMTFSVWYQLSLVYFVDVRSGVVIYFGNPGYLIVRTFVPRIGQTTLTHRLYKIRRMTEVKEHFVWKLDLTSEEGMKCSARLQKVEKLGHKNWIPIFNTSLKLQKNIMLRLKVNTWEREERVLEGVTFAE